MTPPYDFLIVGSGLYGATFAYIASQKGAKCLLIEKRRHLGGNIYCENIEGINVHKYGPHIFHTSDPEVWNFVTSIVPFNRFINSPLAMARDGQIYNLPFNMNMFKQLWGCITPKEAMQIINEQCELAFREMRAQGHTKPINLEQQSLLSVGKDIYELFIKDYTRKQWGKPCQDLPPFIIKRIPIRFTYDNNYFNDTYQGIPIDGYNSLINELLKDTEIKLETDFFINREYWEQCAKKIVYTGAIDQFFNYCYGRLPYRTVEFESYILPVPNYQGNAVVNYTSADVPFTRIIEHKHFESFGEEVYSNPKTIITKEFPKEFKPNMEPFYPINTPEIEQIAVKYRILAQNETKYIFGGRLAEYKYYDMAPLIRKVLNWFSLLSNG